MQTRWRGSTPAWTCVPTSDRRARLIPWLKVLVWCVALIPAAQLVHGAVIGDLGTDPVKTIQNTTGDTTLRLLFITIAITPVRRLTGVNDLIRFRRLLGLFAFFYATLHVLSYIVFDQSLSLALISEDVAKHPWVLLGATGFLLLTPLAITSTRGWIRRLGGRRWRLLHWLIYVIAPLGVLHFYLSVKRDVTRPLQYGAVLLVLLLARVVIRPRRRQAGRASAELLTAEERG